MAIDSVVRPARAETRVSHPDRRQLAAIRVAVLAVAAQALLPDAPQASAAPCSDIEVVFARGTTEAPGLGGVGNAFVDSLRSQVGSKTVEAYAVNYPATQNWPTAIMGVNDAADHIRQVAAQCPSTSIVLGGFSQGAAVAQIATADAAAIPPGSYAYGTTTQLPADVDQHVRAVALFGKPNERFAFMIGQPYVPLGAEFADKTVDMCAVNDPICSGGLDPTEHNAYIANGMVNQAASFAAARV